MKKYLMALLLLLLLAMSFVGVWSLADQDRLASESENRALASKPAFSADALADGSWVRDMETYYTDQFPLREQLLALNRKLNRFYYFSKPSKEGTSLIINYDGGAENGGESLDDVTGQTKPSPDPAEKPEPEPTPDAPQDPEPPDEAPEPTEGPTQEPEHELLQLGTILVDGDVAMDIPTYTESIVLDYAAALNALAASMPDVQVYNLITPNAGEFYSPEEYHTGLHSQKALIDLCYGSLSGVTPVDAYSALQAHQNEYVYFRTDHHWTQLGAYYAYTAFCSARGFEPVPLSSFETGVYENFLGTMYTYTSAYPQGEALAANPDTLTYYLPIVETHAKYYSSTAMTDGVPISVIYRSLEEQVSNKYLCFIGGDHPVTVIESAAEGLTCMVVKESFANAFVPFLTSHYSKIIVVDAREFNQNEKESLVLSQFAAEQGVEDLIVLNYPFMASSNQYVKLLKALAGE